MQTADDKPLIPLDELYEGWVTRAGYTRTAFGVTYEYHWVKEEKNGTTAHINNEQLRERCAEEMIDL